MNWDRRGEKAREREREGEEGEAYDVETGLRNGAENIHENFEEKKAEVLARAPRREYMTIATESSTFRIESKTQLIKYNKTHNGNRCDIV